MEKDEKMLNMENIGEEKSNNDGSSLHLDYLGEISKLVNRRSNTMFDEATANYGIKEDVKIESWNQLKEMESMISSVGSVGREISSE